jgi:hypothetical protein
MIVSFGLVFVFRAVVEKLRFVVDDYYIEIPTKEDIHRNPERYTIKECRRLRTSAQKIWVDKGPCLEVGPLDEQCVLYGQDRSLLTNPATIPLVELLYSPDDRLGRIRRVLAGWLRP